MEYKYCKGCLTNNAKDKHGFSLCPAGRFNYKGKCPCTECVVKVMCGHPCEDFHKFRDRSQAQERFERRYEL